MSRALPGILAWVDSSDITFKQAAQLARSLRRSLAYLGKLRRRMELLGFPPTDPLYQSTARSFDALQELHVRAHYLSCDSGVGNARRVVPSKQRGTL